MEQRETTQIFVAGTRESFARFPVYAQQLKATGKEGVEFSEIEALGLMSSEVLGEAVVPLTVKALIVHAAESPELEASADPLDIGWGRVPQDLNDIIMCGDGVARIIYQGVLRPGKFLRAPVRLPWCK